MFKGICSIFSTSEKKENMSLKDNMYINEVFFEEQSHKPFRGAAPSFLSGSRKKVLLTSEEIYRNQT